jgi:uncharacterized membrane protein YfcA
MIEILGLILTGLIIGVISGTLGIGGGVLLIPVLIWFFKFPPQTATGTTLAVLVPPIGLAAALNYYRHDMMDVHAAIWIAISFAIGAFFGSLAVPYIPKEILRVLFGLLLIYMGILFLLDQHIKSAAWGLIVVGISWVAFLGLKALGRRYQPQRLGASIQRFQKPHTSEPDYHI